MLTCVAVGREIADATKAEPGDPVGQVGGLPHVEAVITRVVQIAPPPHDPSAAVAVEEFVAGCSAKFEIGLTRGGLALVVEVATTLAIRAIGAR